MKYRLIWQAAGHDPVTEMLDSLEEARNAVGSLLAGGALMETPWDIEPRYEPIPTLEDLVVQRIKYGKMLIELGCNVAEGRDVSGVILGELDMLTRRLGPCLYEIDFIEAEKQTVGGGRGGTS